MADRSDRKTNAFIDPEDDEILDDEISPARAYLDSIEPEPKWQTEFRLKMGGGITIALGDWSTACRHAKQRPDQFEHGEFEFRNGPRSKWRSCPVAPPSK